MRSAAVSKKRMRIQRSTCDLLRSTSLQDPSGSSCSTHGLLSIEILRKYTAARTRFR